MASSASSIRSASSASSESDSDMEEQVPHYDIEVLREQAIPLARRAISRVSRADPSILLQYIKTGRYCHVWRVLYSVRINEDDDKERLITFVLRVSRDDAPITSYMIRNEVGCLNYIAFHLSHIPAPKVFAWDDGSLGSRAFIAESFIEGQLLSTVWPLLSMQQKCDITNEIINVLIHLGETRFQFIGGLTPDGSPGPLVEKVQVHKGRQIFYKPENIEIGPYKDAKGYLISCYHREIFYWSHADQNPQSRKFGPEEVNLLLASLEDSLSDLMVGASGDSVLSLEAQPWVLHNEDFNSRNMMVHNGHLAGIIDWKFSGVRPLSVVNIENIIVPDDDISLCTPTGELGSGLRLWNEEILKILKDAVRRKGWSDHDIDALFSPDDELEGMRVAWSPRDNSESVLRR